MMLPKSSKISSPKFTPRAASLGWILLSVIFCVVAWMMGVRPILIAVTGLVGVIPAVLHWLLATPNSRESNDIWVVLAWTLVGLTAILMSGGMTSPLIIMLAIGPVFALSVGRYRLGLEASLFAAVICLCFVLADVFAVPGMGVNRMERLPVLIAGMSIVQIGLYAAGSGAQLAERRGLNRQGELLRSTLADTPVLVLNLDNAYRVRSWVGDLDLLPDVTAKQLSRARMRDLFNDLGDFLAGRYDGSPPVLKGEGREGCDVASVKTRDGFRFIITPKWERAAETGGSNAAVWVASLGHELKNMLNPVGGYSDLILAERAGPLSEPYKDFARSIKQGAEHLSLLVEDLMTAAKSRAGKLRLEPEILDAIGETEDVIKLLQWQADAHGVTLMLAEPDEEEAGLYVTADRKALRQVLINLLSNAIKYSPSGEEVEIGLAEEIDFVRFSVSDHGEGLPEEELARLGEAFFQGENARSRTGTGLGLSIVKLLAEELDGKVRFESQLGMGTTAHFYLPKADPASLSTEQAAE